MESMVTEDEVHAWFARYLAAFTSLGRGESTAEDVATHFGVTSLVTTDDVVLTLTSGSEVTRWLAAQADAMIATAYDHTEVLETTVRIENGTTATLRALLARRRADSSLIARLEVAYVVVRDRGELRVHALVGRPV